MRDPDVGRFLAAMDLALRDAAEAGSPAARAGGLVLARCHERVGRTGTVRPVTLPVCDWIDAALEMAEGGPRQALADAFAGLVDRLDWGRRGSARPEDREFWAGHANAMICGPGGLEEREDLWIGATVMAPGVAYGDHDHPPEEVYVALTPGEWRNAATGWTDPGLDGLFYNPPGIRHAMRAGREPFLAFWLLPV